MTIYWIVTITLMFCFNRLFCFVIPLALLELICLIIGAVKSSEGEGVSVSGGDSVCEVGG